MVNDIKKQLEIEKEVTQNIIDGNKQQADEKAKELFDMLNSDAFATTDIYATVDAPVITDKATVQEAVENNEDEDGNDDSEENTVDNIGEVPEEEPVIVNIKEPVKAVVEEPVKRTRRAKAVKVADTVIAQEPVKATVQEPVTATIQEPVKVTIQEPVKEPVKEPVTATVQEPIIDDSKTAYGIVINKHFVEFKKKADGGYERTNIAYDPAYIIDKKAFQKSAGRMLNLKSARNIYFEVGGEGNYSSFVDDTVECLKRGDHVKVYYEINVQGDKIYYNIKKISKLDSVFKSENKKVEKLYDAVVIDYFITLEDKNKKTITAKYSTDIFESPDEYFKEIQDEVKAGSTLKVGRIIEIQDGNEKVAAKIRLNSYEYGLYEKGEKIQVYKTIKGDKIYWNINKLQFS